MDLVILVFVKVLVAVLINYTTNLLEALLVNHVTNPRTIHPANGTDFENRSSRMIDQLVSFTETTSCQEEVLLQQRIE